MKYYPLYIKLEGKRCIVIGGGRVAERKVSSLLGAGASVTIISPSSTDKLKKLECDRKIYMKSRGYRKGDLRGAFIVIAASNKKEINERVYKEAKERGIMMNRADDVRYCDFIFPSTIHKKGEIIISISTSGKKPSVSKAIRNDIESLLHKKYGYAFDDLNADK